MQPTMVPFVLPNILDIAQDCSQGEYINNILPHLKPLMKLLDPIQVNCQLTTHSRNARIVIDFYFMNGHTNCLSFKSYGRNDCICVIKVPLKITVFTQKQGEHLNPNWGI